MYLYNSITSNRSSSCVQKYRTFLFPPSVRGATGQPFDTLFLMPAVLADKLFQTQPIASLVQPIETVLL